MSYRFFVSTHSSSGTAGRPSLGRPTPCSSPHASKDLIATVETLSLYGSSAAKGCPDGMEADWTNNATPLYVLLSDVFGQQIPAAYSTVLI